MVQILKTMLAIDTTLAMASVVSPGTVSDTAPAYEHYANAHDQTTGKIAGLSHRPVVPAR